jgi:hypothetical protein
MTAFHSGCEHDSLHRHLHLQTASRTSPPPPPPPTQRSPSHLAPASCHPTVGSKPVSICTSPPHTRTSANRSLAQLQTALHLNGSTCAVCQQEHLSSAKHLRRLSLTTPAHASPTHSCPKGNHTHPST